MSEPWEPRNAWLMRYAAYEEMHKCIPGGSQAPPDCQGLLGHTTSPPLELVHRSKQKIHHSATLHAALPELQPCQDARHLNHLNASVH
jgi:hypothetical protein